MRNSAAMAKNSVMHTTPRPISSSAHALGSAMFLPPPLPGITVLHVHTAPPVYMRLRAAPEMSVIARIAAFALAGACLAVLIVASRLSPDVSGMGTHHQLGLQPCGFLQRTGLPCPTCGMTTSFAQLIHGRPLASFYVQPAGFVVAILSGVVFWIGLYESITGRPVHRLLALLPMSYHLFPLIAVLLAGWAWKIFIHLRGIDGWGG
jgi:hypothetical protein